MVLCYYLCLERDQYSCCRHHLVNVSQWLLILYQHLRELQALIRADSHHTSQQEDPVWGIANLEISERIMHVWEALNHF